jgi:hypothetical protein
MASARMRFVFTALAFVAIAGLHAQTQSGTKSASIQIVAVVPTILKLSLDFCAGEATQVDAYFPSSNNTARARFSPAKGEIRENSVIELGDARIFSNTNESYSVDIYSANGGMLRADSGSTIPYSLTLGGRSASNRDGAFSFQTRGRTSMEGSALMVALNIAGVPASAAEGNYSDQLMFSLSAN